MNGFSGFPDGKQPFVMLPSPFFTQLLPSIDHLVELKVTLYCFWFLNMQEGDFRYVRFSEACRDETFLKGLSAGREDVTKILRDGFERAVARGTLLHVRVELSTGEDDIYFMNTEKGRAAANAIEIAEWSPDDSLRPIALVLERPPIFTIYEQNIGALTPLIAEELQDLEKEYSYLWLKDAIRIATLNRVTSLKYIVGILKRWEKEGRSKRHSPTEKLSDEDHMNYLKSKYPDLFEG